MIIMDYKPRDLNVKFWPTLRHYLVFYLSNWGRNSGRNNLLLPEIPCYRINVCFLVNEILTRLIYTINTFNKEKNYI